MSLNQPKRSCSTFIALSPVTTKGDIIFGKNSDRPVNESQPLEFYPSCKHEKGSMVNCTYIQIPEIDETYSYIGSRPYNLYGFEHGLNEHGVVIGNEAVSGREKPELQWGLIGMDILRLGLARSRTAKEAVEIMGELLERYGTGGDPNIRPQYFNANYIIADHNEAYIFESCQRYWVAKKVDKAAHIGNIYDIKDDYDMIGKNVIKEVTEKGWYRKGERINVSEAFSISDCDYEDAEAYFRYIRQDKLLMKETNIDVSKMMNILRDHYSMSDRKIIPFDVATSKMPSICCHPGGMNGCATAASVVCSLDKNAEVPFRMIYWGSMAPPCCSVFIPMFNIKWIPEKMALAGPLYRSDSPWWIFTELERYTALSFNEFKPLIGEKFGSLEKEFIENVEHIKSNYNGDIEELKKLTNESLDRSVEMAKGLIEAIQNHIPKSNINYLMKDYFKEAAEGCGMQHKLSF